MTGTTTWPSCAKADRPPGSGRYYDIRDIETRAKQQRRELTVDEACYVALIFT